MNKLHSQILKLYHAAGLPLHTNHFGSKVNSEYQKLAIVLLFRRSKLSLRDFVSQLTESRWPAWLGLRELPSKSTLHSWCARFSTSLLRQLNRLALKKEKPSLLAIDATGIDRWQRSRHYEQRTRAERLKYTKLNLFVDVKKQIIHDFVVQVQPRHDVVAAKQMFRRVRLKRVKILGDKGYDCEELHELAQEKSNLFFAPVRKRSRRRIKGWNRRRCVKGDDDYRFRPLIESCIRSLKAKRMPALRSKRVHMIKKEVAMYLLIHNLRKIIALLRMIYRSFWTELFLTKAL